MMKFHRKFTFGMPQGSFSDVLSLPVPVVSALTRGTHRLFDRLVHSARSRRTARTLSIPIDVETFAQTGFITMPRIIQVTCALCGTAHHTLWELKMIASSGRCSACVDAMKDDMLPPGEPTRGHRVSADSM